MSLLRSHHEKVLVFVVALSAWPCLAAEQGQTGATYTPPTSNSATIEQLRAEIAAVKAQYENRIKQLEPGSLGGTQAGAWLPAARHASELGAAVGAGQCGGARPPLLPRPVRRSAHAGPL